MATPGPEAAIKQAIRAIAPAGIELKRGPMGCIVDPVRIPEDLADKHGAEPALRENQIAQLYLLYDACLQTDRDRLVDVIPPEEMSTETARPMAQIYDAGIRPDWWKLPPTDDAAESLAIGDVIRARDPYCCGMVVPGLNAPVDELARSFEAARDEPPCRDLARALICFLGIGMIIATFAIIPCDSRPGGCRKDYEKPESAKPLLPGLPKQ